jgi:hypothetical protein
MTGIAMKTDYEIALILFYAGHIAGDFFLQSGEVAEGKKEHTGLLLRHGFLIWISHLTVLLPFWNIYVVIGTSLIALVHTAVDGIKGSSEKRWHMPLTIFVLDQVVHWLVILSVWIVLKNFNLLRDVWVTLPLSWMTIICNVAIVASGYIFIGKGGTAVVRGILEQFSLPQIRDVPNGVESTTYSMGRTIGCLERVLVYTLVLIGQWGVLGLVIAAKSIARFRELERQHFADYYLIGTLSSIIVAIAAGLVVRSLR